MKRKLLSILALLCLTVSGAWADNEQGPTYTITLSGCDNTSFNITVNDATLPYVIDKIGDLGWKLDAPTVIHPYCQDFTNVYVKSGGEGKVSVDWVWNKMTITITGAFQGKATIQCDGEGYDPGSDDPFYDSRDIYVTCVSNGPYTVDSGNCGTSGHETDVTWSLTSDGVLTISGSGAMKDYTSNINAIPWKNYHTTITSIVIEDGVTAIGNYAFRGCSSAKSVSIPDGLTTIGSYAFYSCKMESVDIPDDVTTIGTSAFQKCSNLETVTIPGSVTSFGGSVFKECTGLKSVDILDGVTGICSSAFYGCTGLKSVPIPASVTSISSSAFYGCTSLESVDIPATVTKIESNAFYGCTSLTSINLYTLYTADNRLTLTGTNAFDNCHGDLKIHVFSDYVDAYKTAPTWSSIEGKITPISVTANPDGTGYYWATYYNDLANAKIPDDDTYTQVFKVALSGSTLTLTEISDRVINMGEGVVLKSNSPSITLASAASTGTEAVGGYEGNDLTGTMNSITNPGNAYVLNKTATNGVGFYRLSSEGTIGAHKAYLTYSGDLARAFFLFDEATGIAPIDNGQWIMDNEADAVVYDMQGRRVSQPVKGLYIVNGKKYIKK